MKRLIVAAVCSLTLLGAAASYAEATHASGGLGFHTSSAPIGLRWWLAGQKVGLDAGIGFGSAPSGISADDKVSNYTIDVGVPFVMKSWDGLHLLFRPGLVYNSQQIGFDSGGKKYQQFGQNEPLLRMFTRDYEAYLAGGGLTKLPSQAEAAE